MQQQQKKNIQIIFLKPGDHNLWKFMTMSFFIIIIF